MWIVFKLHGYGPMAGSSDHGNELSGPVKGGENLDKLITVLISEDHSIELCS
jgi:hypothetical protein